MNVAVLDSGAPISLRVIRDLTELPGVGTVTAVTPDRDHIANFAAEREFSDSLVVTGDRQADLREAVSASDVVVSCDVHGRFENLVETFDAGKIYVSACETVAGVESLLSLSSKASAAGVLIVPGAGLSPGLTGIMAARAVADLEQVNRIRICWMASTDEGFGPLVDRMARAFKGNAVVFKNGQWERRPAGEEDEEVYFPLPVGWRTVRLAAGAEVLTMPAAFDGLRSLVIKAGVTEGAINLLTKAISGVPETKGPFTRERLVRVGGRILPTIGRMSGSRQTWSAARVDAYGTKDGVATTSTVGVLDQLSNLVSASLVTTAALALKGELKGRGVVPAEKMIEPRTFLEELALRGVRTARLSSN